MFHRYTIEQDNNIGDCIQSTEAGSWNNVQAVTLVAFRCWCHAVLITGVAGVT